MLYTKEIEIFENKKIYVLSRQYIMCTLTYFLYNKHVTDLQGRMTSCLFLFLSFQLKAQKRFHILLGL